MQNIRVEIEDLTPVKKKLDISVPAETVRKEIDAAYRTIRTNASIPGFRKGSIPMNIIKARFRGLHGHGVRLYEHGPVQGLEPVMELPGPVHHASRECLYHIRH